MAFAFANRHLLDDAEALTSQQRSWACDVTVATVNNSPGQQKWLYMLLEELWFSANSSPKRSLLCPCSKERESLLANSILYLILTSSKEMKKRKYTVF